MRRDGVRLLAAGAHQRCSEGDKRGACCSLAVAAINGSKQLQNSTATGTAWLKGAGARGAQLAYSKTLGIEKG